MKKKFLIGCLTALALSCGLVATAVSQPTVAKAEEQTESATMDTSLTGLAWKNNGLCFTLSDTDYADVPSNAIPGDRVEEYNYMDEIIVYKGEESKTLGEIAHGDIFYNMWTVPNTYTVQIEESWRTGVTKVVVPTATQFPSAAYTGYTPWSADNSAVTTQPTTDEKISYATTFEVVYTVDENGNFIAQKNVPVVETEIAVKNLHIRGNYNAGEDRDHCFLIFFLSELDCEGSTVAIGPALFEYNFLDKVKLWTSETEYITLGEAYNHEKGTKEAYYNLWGEQGTVAVHLGNYNGASFVKITIDEGCQFPSYAYTSGQVTAEKPAYVQKRAAECTPTSTEDAYMVTSWRILVDNSVAEDLPVVTQDIAVRSDDFIGIQIRGDENDTNAQGNPHCFIIFYLPEDIEDFPGIDSTTGKPTQTAISPARAKLYNTLDNILLWTSETEYILLRDAYEREGGTKEMYYNIWGESNCVAYDLGGYHGGSFVKITILKGCEFPSYNFTEVELYPTERKAYTQAASINFIDWSTDTYFSTNWRADTQKGVASVEKVAFNLSGEDNLLKFTFSGTDYPTDGEMKIETGGLEQLFPNDDFFSNIYLDGVPVSDYKNNNSAEWITAYFNYDEYGSFAFNVPGLTKDSDISSIILRKGFCFPAFDNPSVSLREYRVIYYSLASAVEFRKDANGEWTMQENVRWTVTFDGENAIEVVDGERIADTAYPANPEKKGYTFLGWYNGEREWRPTDRVTENINLVAKFQEDPQAEKTEKKGCSSAIALTAGGWIMLAGVAVFLKKVNKKQR